MSSGEARVLGPVCSSKQSTRGAPTGSVLCCRDARCRECGTGVWLSHRAGWSPELEKDLACCRTLCGFCLTICKLVNKISMSSHR